MVGLLAAGCDERSPGVSTGSGLFGGNPDVGFETPWWGEEGPGAPGGTFDLQPVGGWMEGSLGEVRDFSGEITLAQSYGSALMVESGGEGWAAMAMFQFATGTLEAGESFGVNGIGCSGPSSGEWETDVPAREIELVYTPSENEGEPGVIDAVLHFDGGSVSAAVYVE